MEQNPCRTTTYHSMNISVCCLQSRSRVRCRRVMSRSGKESSDDMAVAVYGLLRYQEVGACVPVQQNSTSDKFVVQDYVGRAVSNSCGVNRARQIWQFQGMWLASCVPERVRFAFRNPEVLGNKAKILRVTARPIEILHIRHRANGPRSFISHKVGASIRPWEGDCSRQKKAKTRG